MGYVVECLLAAVIAVLSYYLGQSNSKLKEKEKVADSAIKAEQIRNEVKPNDTEAMASDPFNRDNRGK